LSDGGKKELKKLIKEKEKEPKKKKTTKQLQKQYDQAKNDVNAVEEYRSTYYDNIKIEIRIFIKY
jgi:hypothetical protein